MCVYIINNIMWLLSLSGLAHCVTKSTQSRVLEGHYVSGVSILSSRVTMVLPIMLIDGFSKGTPSTAEVKNDSLREHSNGDYTIIIIIIFVYVYMY